MDSHDSNDRSMKGFGDLINAYARGKYRGPTGWSQLRYALQLRFDMQGMTGALMNGAITREMVTAPGIIQEERHDQATLDYFNNFLRGIRRLSVATTP